MFKEKINTGTLEKINGELFPVGVIFKNGNKIGHLCMEVLISFIYSFLTGSCAAVAAVPWPGLIAHKQRSLKPLLSESFSLSSYYRFCGTNQHLPIRK